MKRNSYLAMAIILGLSIGLISCEKNAVQKIDKPVPNGAQVKFYNFSVGSPSVNFYVNDVKVSAILSSTGTQSATGTAFAGVFPGNNNYTIITPGDNVFKAIISSTATTDPNVTVSTLNASVELSKQYSFFTCGLYNTTTKTSDALLIQDETPAVDTSAAYIRFVNLVPNAATNFDFVIQESAPLATDIPVKVNVAYKGYSEFIKVPKPAVYTVYARKTGSPTNTITRTDVAFRKGLVYTLVARGNATTASTLGFDLTRNR